ncbi:hypothetical protein DENSPDRAFT_886706 [Dentipellis sp. KUC8613]|nr:hypothetical protein DENSPDRAFT_886706 [Dentipellis sp. KUC8613]
MCQLKRSSLDSHCHRHRHRHLALPPALAYALVSFFAAPSSPPPLFHLLRRHLDAPHCRFTPPCVLRRRLDAPCRRFTPPATLFAPAAVRPPPPPFHAPAPFAAVSTLPPRRLPPLLAAVHLHASSFAPTRRVLPPRAVSRPRSPSRGPVSPYLAPARHRPPLLAVFCPHAPSRAHHRFHLSTAAAPSRHASLRCCPALSYRPTPSLALAPQHPPSRCCKGPSLPSRCFPLRAHHAHARRRHALQQSHFVAHSAAAPSRLIHARPRSRPAALRCPPVPSVAALPCPSAVLPHPASRCCDALSSRVATGSVVFAPRCAVFVLRRPALSFGRPVLCRPAVTPFLHRCRHAFSLGVLRHRAAISTPSPLSPPRPRSTAPRRRAAINPFATVPTLVPPHLEPSRPCHTAVTHPLSPPHPRAAIPTLVPLSRTITRRSRHRPTPSRHHLKVDFPLFARLDVVPGLARDFALEMLQLYTSSVGGIARPCAALHAPQRRWTVLTASLLFSPPCSPSHRLIPILTTSHTPYAIASPCLSSQRHRTHALRHLAAQCTVASR